VGGLRGGRTAGDAAGKTSRLTFWGWPFCFCGVGWNFAWGWGMNYTGGMGFGTGASGWGSGARGVGSVLVLLGLVAGPARAEPSAGPVAKAAEKQDELSEALAAITKSRASLKTLSVPFTQERELSLLSSKVTSKGSLVLARPDKMRWRLEAPDDATYWVSKAGIAYRTKDGSGKVTSGESGAMAALLDDVLMVVGGDLDRLKARYAMSATREGSLRVLSLLPKLAAVQKMVKLLVVSIDDTGVPKRLVLTEPEGDSTTIVFGEAKKNVAIDPSMLAAPLVRSFVRRSRCVDGCARSGPINEGGRRSLARVPTRSLRCGSRRRACGWGRAAARK
jgi:outer membrane lipoprotein-sorting protein